MQRYTAYGLAIASELALPELTPDAGSGPADLTVRLGPTPERIAEPVVERVLWTAAPGAWLHEIPGVGRFYVHRDGAEVVIERRGGTDVDLRAFLFGSTLGAILHQRELFALHASAAVVEGGAVAVAGPSGVGKSTTLAELARRGHPVLSDDKTVVRPGPEGPMVLPGYPTLRLWVDAAKRLGVAHATLPLLRGSGRKVLYPAPAFSGEAVPLRALVVLAIGAHVEASPLSGPAAVSEVVRVTYRRGMIRGFGLEAAHFRWAAGLAGAVPVIRMTRPKHEDTTAAVVEAVEAAATATR